jgi:hypothetical protein
MNMCFECIFAWVAWSIIQVVSNLYQQQFVRSMVGNLVTGISTMLNIYILVVAIALCWSLYFCMNDVAFYATKISLYVVGLYSCTR